MKYFYMYKKQVIWMVLVLTFQVASAQNVGITDKTTVTTPDASAGLDIDFSTKGLLIPRVALSATNLASPIASPTVSLLVYNTATSPATDPAATAVSPGYYYYSGAAWIRLATGTTGWEITGNSGTTAGTNFLGTTDDQDLVFKTGVVGKEIGRLVNSTGYLQLGDESKKTDITYRSEGPISYIPAPSAGTLSAWNELVMRQDGDQYGSSIFKLRNRNGMNGAILETTTNSLTDLIFQPPSTIQSNIRYEGRSSVPENLALSTGSTTNSNYPEWQIGFPANPTLVISSATAANTTGLPPTGGNSSLRFGNFGIGSTATAVVNGITIFTSDPTASLHIIRAGTGTAGTAPMKFTSGVDLGTAEAGAFEYDGLRLGFTPASAVRKRVVLTNDALPGNGQIPIGNGTDFTTASIIAGTGITLTPGAGTLTIAGSGGVYSAGAGISLTGTMFSNNLTTGIAGGQSAIGGTGITDALNLQGTTANGTLTSPAVQIKVGNNGATTAETILNNGNVGIGVTAPTATLELKAGTSTAGTAPLKINPGPLLTNPENGVIEFDGIHYYGSITTAGVTTRYQLDRQYTLAANTKQFSAINPASNTFTSSQLTYNYYYRIASVTPVTIGLAVGSTPFVITPSRSGTLMITISGTFYSGTNNKGASVQIRYGSSASPAQGSSTPKAGTVTTTGAALGSTVSSSEAGVYPFSVNAIIGPLSIGVPYWIDLALNGVDTTTLVYVGDISASVLEL
ncbi:MAG: hypothetical protein JWN56_760 [Sphingobacteriales bacterium]|nr:hypothetical protein [Sphingobacteriales bacterium]